MIVDVIGDLFKGPSNHSKMSKAWGNQSCNCTYELCRKWKDNMLIWGTYLKINLIIFRKFLLPFWGSVWGS